MRIALVAHDAIKPAMVGWAGRHREMLRHHELFATGTTGGELIDRVGLDVTRLLSGPVGGDQQLGAMIAEARIDALIFFFDPMSAVPHDMDAKALLRIATLHGTIFAMNESTAEVLISHFGSGREAAA